jgi:hypothetical protein
VEVKVGDRRVGETANTANQENSRNELPGFRPSGSQVGSAIAQSLSNLRRDVMLYTYLSKPTHADKSSWWMRYKKLTTERSKMTTLGNDSCTCQDHELLIMMILLPNMM